MPAANPPPEPGVTSEEYRQRALLFADLGRYDEAADEIAAGLAAAPADPAPADPAPADPAPADPAPDLAEADLADAALLATLARIHLAADQPAEALVAADRAVAAAPEEINPLVVRAMALTDNSRYSEAARVATEVLHRWPNDPYALRTGAALLSEARNGQEALNAAWEAVRLAPVDAEAHLVLAVVAARLRLFDLAQRAYGEALELDAGISDARRDVGIIRLERRRWARALEDLAGQAALGTPVAGPDLLDRPDAESPDAPGPGNSPAPQSDSSSQASRSGKSRASNSGEQTSQAGERASNSEERAGERSEAPAPPSVPIARPTHPVLDPSEDSAAAFRQAVLYGANGTLIASVLTAAMTAASAGASRAWAAMIGILLLIAVPIWLVRRLTEPLPSALARLRERDRRGAIAAYAVLAAPIVLVLYAGVGGRFLLIIAMVIAAAAQMPLLVRRS